MKEKFLSAVLIVISILIFNSCFHEQNDQREISIIPKPQKIEQGEDNFVLNSNTVLVVPNVDKPQPNRDFSRL